MSRAPPPHDRGDRTGWLFCRAGALCEIDPEFEGKHVLLTYSPRRPAGGWPQRCGWWCRVTATAAAASAVRARLIGQSLARHPSHRRAANLSQLRYMPTGPQFFRGAAGGWRTAIRSRRVPPGCPERRAGRTRARTATFPALASRRPLCSAAISYRQRCSAVFRRSNPCANRDRDTV